VTDEELSELFDGLIIVGFGVEVGEAVSSIHILFCTS
jgi:Ca2+/Na+ antiporter